MTRNLDLALVGNGCIGLLVDGVGTIVWGCFPRFDGDPTFCALLDEAPAAEARGIFAIELEGFEFAEQEYLANTALLVTRLYDKTGAAIEITDCAPRFQQYGRTFHPMALVRHVRRLSGNPRIVIRLRPAGSYGSTRPQVTVGRGNVRYVMPDVALRLTTDASLTAIVEEKSLALDDALTLLLGPDETAAGTVAELGRRLIDETTAYWRDWVRRLAIPFEWQSAVLRAAITLKQIAYNDTGAIVSAITTSIPALPASGRSWDHRHCWLRDGYLVVDALNRLGATEAMEDYVRYVVNIAANVGEGPLHPAYSISGSAPVPERVIDSLPGYRGLRPVRVGNDAAQQVQHDVYGAAILASMHLFFDDRLARFDDATLFERLEALGRRACAMFDQPDTDIWELHGVARVHTFSVVMCWAACDRLVRIATKIGRPDRAQSWRADAARIARFVDEHCYCARRGSFGGHRRRRRARRTPAPLSRTGFCPTRRSAVRGTVRAIERELKHGEFILRYSEHDNSGPSRYAVRRLFILVRERAREVGEME